MNKKIIPYGRHFISDEDIEAVIKVLKSDNLTQGPVINEFEIAFAKYIGCKYAIAVSNGTAALHIGVLALNLKPGQKVITSPISFVATANCIKYCGAEVVFSDIDPFNFLLDLEKLEKLLENAPIGTYSGVIPVDFAGFPIHMEKLKKIASKYNLWILEDACHAPGAYFIDSFGEKQNCGNGLFADISIFSFHPVKHIATGEGGMITTNSREFYEKLLKLRTHGITKNPEILNNKHFDWFYEMQVLGYNYRLTDIQASLGLSQLNRAEQGLEKRKAIAKKYDQEFSSVSKILHRTKITDGHAYHLYNILVEERDSLYNYLKSKNIFCQVHYIPIYKHPFYVVNNFSENLLNTEEYFKMTLSIPIYPTLTYQEQDFVIKEIKLFLQKDE